MGFLDYGTSITLKEAKRCAAAAEAEAEKHGWPLVIAVVDAGGNLVYFARMDNAHLACIELAEKKARTAVFYRCDTSAFEEAIAQGGANLRFLGVDSIMPMGGGVLIVKDGKIIGAIATTGAEADDDIEAAKAGAAAL